MDTIDTSPEKSPLGYQISYKILPRVQKSGHKDTERRLDFAIRLDEITGQPIGFAWKTFGYKGPKFHDGFLYGEPNYNLEMTGILWVGFKECVFFFLLSNCLHLYVHNFFCIYLALHGIFLPWG